MLKSLYIKNYALIDELQLEFQNGLNIITGETGAGKSIMVDAFMIALGERASASLIRNNEKKAIVEATFDINDLHINELNISDIDEVMELLEDSQDLVLRREINLKGNSRSFINDSLVTVNTLKEVGDRLVDFHGQHQHQQLLNSAYHLTALDATIGDDNKLKAYADEYKTYKSKIKALKDLEEKAKEAKITSDHYKFELEEIDKIAPRENELDEIEKKLEILENSEKIFSIVNELDFILNEADSSILNQLKHAEKLISQLVEYDGTFGDFQAECNSAYISLKEISRYSSSFKANFDFESGEVEQLKSRYLELNGLKKKYSSYEEVFTRIDFLKTELSSYSNYDLQIDTLKAEILSHKKSLTELAIAISNIRKERAVEFENELTDKLKYLGMENAKFQIHFAPNPHNELFDSGIDKVYFLISTNPGEPLKQLKEVASGGEISRIMLAIKYIISESKQMPMLVFDEIDNGISGKIGQKTGLLMKKLAAKHQILAITHLPQIAALGDTNFFVSKHIEGNTTNTKIRTLDEDDKVKMVAQMLSGEEITDSALENAKKLIEHN